MICGKKMDLKLRFLEIYIVHAETPAGMGTIILHVVRLFLGILSLGLVMTTELPEHIL